MKRWKIGAAMAVLGLVAAGCGSSGSDGASGEATTTAAASKETTTTAAQATTTTAAVIPKSMEEWEKLWTAQRADVVKRIKAAGGVAADGKSATGVDGYKIDLSKCPAGWSQTEGLTDTEIKIGQTLPQAGPAADYGNVGRAMTAMFDTLSTNGYFTDSKGKNRKVNYIIKDDGYDPTRTIPLVDELIDSAKVFAVATLGTAPALKTYDKLNQRCIPQPFVQSGHPAWGDPVNHPWTTGQQMAYTTESTIWGAFVDQRFDELKNASGKVVVASLVSNNDFGKAYDLGFKTFIAGSKHAKEIEYVSETVEATAPTVTDPMTTLASKKPQVFIAMVFSSYCTMAVTEAAQNGMKESAKYLFQPSVCPGNTYVKTEKVGGNGMGADGWWQVNAGGKDINDPTQFSDPFVAYARDVLTKHGIDPKDSSTLGSGIYFAWAWIQALKIAGELDGGLTRANLALATHAIDMTHPYHLPGILFNVSGTKDAYYTEGGILQKWSAAKQIWEVQGNPIDLSGKSKLCAFDQSAGTCKTS